MEKVILKAIDQIKEDINNNDIDALYELLSKLNKKTVFNFLNEETQEELKEEIEVDKIHKLLTESYGNEYCRLRTAKGLTAFIKGETVKEAKKDINFNLNHHDIDLQLTIIKYNYCNVDGVKIILK
tara:strand:- start:15860 stop:16237 length:378 start_codon:yes stop_codon:yes gene_type:complete